MSSLSLVEEQLTGDSYAQCHKHTHMLVVRAWSLEHAKKLLRCPLVTSCTCKSSGSQRQSRMQDCRDTGHGARCSQNWASADSFMFAYWTLQHVSCSWGLGAGCLSVSGMADAPITHVGSAFQGRQ